MDRPERWLVVSYLANVEGMTASYHVDDRLRHLQAAGVEVEVITGVCGPRPAGWGGRWRRVLSPDPSGLRYEIRHVAGRWPRPWGVLAKGLLTAVLLPFYVLEKCLANLESSYCWWVPAALVGLRRTRRRRPDVIYSTGGPLASHRAAAAIARRRGIPWIAEIRDPLPYNAPLRGWLHRRVVTRLEGLIHARATGVVYVTRTACERALARTKSRAACTAICPGGEALEGGGEHDPRRLRLVHAGSLGGSRHPGVLLEALARLAGRRPDVREGLRLTLLGEMDHQTRAKVASFPYPEMVEAVEKRPRQAARALVAGADAALVIQNLAPVSEETIPSKTYDYLVSGKPVVALLFRNQELTAMLREGGHTVAAADDAAAIEAALEEVFTRAASGQLTAAPDPRYTRARAAEELLAWCRQVCARTEEEVYV